MPQLNSLKIEIGGITPANVEQLKVINVSTLPVRYSDKFYKDLVEQGDSNYLKFALCNGFNVGAICARVENVDKEGCHRLYIMTLNVLPTYRRRGIASQLLKYILDVACRNNNIIEVTLNVQTSNDDAISFYANHGFENVGKIDNYYKRVIPPDAYILRLDLNKYRQTISS